MYYYVFVLGAKWQIRRKILTPAFHFNILRQFINILTEKSSHMVQSLKHAEGVVVEDLVSFISEHALNVICGNSFYILCVYVTINFILNEKKLKIVVN